MAPRPAFRTPQGEAVFRAVYDAALRRWPVPFEERALTSRFGSTHVVVSGPVGAPPLVLLHGHVATLLMWVANVADLAADHRVYAVDVMGQPSKSIPDAPIRSPEEYNEWLSATLDALGLARVSLVGMSFGGWLALRYAIAAPERVERLVLLSAGGVLAMRTRFFARGMVMTLLPNRFTVRWFMRWAGFRRDLEDPRLDIALDIMRLGLAHFLMPKETVRAMPPLATDEELRSLRMPVLFLMGDREVLCDPEQALARVRELVPDIQGELLAGCSHDMTFSRSEEVDARIIRFLESRVPAR